MQTERIVPLARQLLTLSIDEDRNDLWLWEHSERVMHLAQLIATLPEAAQHQADSTALAAAALFHDAGWKVEYDQRRLEPWQLLTRPTNDIQRELGAAMLLETVGHLLPATTARLAADAIRQCNHRNSDLPEARILAEAEALDEVGVLYVLRQFRQYQAEGRPLEQLVNSWQRQKEYDYWEARLDAGFRYDATRALARRRLAAVDSFMAALRQSLQGEDLRQMLEPGDAALTGKEN